MVMIIENKNYLFIIKSIKLILTMTYQRGSRNIFRVIFGFMVMSLAMFIFISILSYNELDPSFNTIRNSDIILNRMGIGGSYVSDLFIQLFGVVSFFIVFIIMKIGFNTFRLKLVRYNIYLKIIMFIMSVLSGCAFMSKLFSGTNHWGYETYGGTVGYYINNLTGYFPYYKTLICFYLLCFILSTNILLDLSYKKITIIVVKTYRRLKKIMGFILKLSLKVICLFIPNRIINTINTVVTKIKNIINKNKYQQQNYENLINIQNRKIENLEKYIKNIENNGDVEDISDHIRNNENRKENGIFSFLSNKDGDKKVKNINNIKYKLPNNDLLESSNNKIVMLTKDELKEQASDLIKVLKDFKINGKIIEVKAGPVITLHEFEPSAGTKSSRIIGLADDIARNLKVKSARISVIPEKNAIGIELPNKTRNTIFLKDIFESDEYKHNKYSLPIVLGSNIAGDPVIMDLAKAPHLLIAGTTGSGKSVSINTMILSMLYKFAPDECKMVMIDPKMLELSVYEGIPHLLTPVVTEPKKAVMALKWVVNEMDNRYKLMSSLGVRNIYGYNEKIKQSIEDGVVLTTKTIIDYDEYGEPIYETKELETKKLPFIVVVVDEMADLMITAGKDIEVLIQRIAQKARAAGIHIIMATQRPSVDVITGVIKANFPSRISFLVSSKIDSKVIIGEQGADQLLGMGDMLYLPNGGKISRAHGPFVSDEEVERVVKYIIKQGIKPEYVKNMAEDDDEENDSGGDFDISINGDKVTGDDSLYEQAINVVRKDKKVSISYIQRQLRIGYNKAANFVEQMEKDGIVSPPGINGKRELIE